MAVGLINQSAVQEMSIALNQGAAAMVSDRLSPREKETERIERRTAQEISAAELMEKGQGKGLAVEILKPFFAKLAQVGITIGTQSKLSRENEEMLREFAKSEGGFEDSVEIKSDSPVITEVKRLKQREEEAGRRALGGQASTDEILSLLKEYAGVFADYLSSHAPDLFEQLKSLKEKLIARGISEEKLLKLDAQIKSGRNIDIGAIIKESLIMEALAFGQVEKTAQRRRLTDLLEGLGKEKAAAVIDGAKEAAKQELQSFVLEELENVLVRKTHTQDKNYSDAYKLIKLAEKTGLDYSRWLADVWPQKKDNHGLCVMDVPHSATGMNVDVSTGRQPQKHGFEYEKQDENEVLINRLRALYMQRALKGDALTHLRTEFKIRKLKNGLFKLGIFTKDLDNQVKHEAEAVAKEKIIEMLKEALVERATFYELAGPAHELVERKIKGLIKNAERLHLPISAEEFNSLRDNANCRVFDLSKRELDEVRTRRCVKDSSKLEKKEKLLVKLLARLNEESKIEG